MTIRPRLSHFGIFVHDVAVMEAFYTKVFGLVATDRGKGFKIHYDFVFLSSSPSQHHQLVLASGRPPEATFSTVLQMSFKVTTLDELRATKAAALANGALSYEGLNHGNAWSIYFRDPEGNTVEVYLDTPFYVPQPHAHVLDLAKSDAEILAETEANCHADPGFMPVKEWEATFAGRLAKGD
jgi:catechol 2,3-dioxygenase